MRIAHAMIQVRDLDGAIAFYRDALGLRLVERFDYEGAALAYLQGRDAGVEIELLCETPWTFAPRPERGRSHIALAVAEVTAEHARLTALGLAPGPIQEFHAGGRLQTRYCYLYDPEGNEVEILQAMGRYRTAQETP